MTHPMDGDDRRRSWVALGDRLRDLLRDEYELLSLLGYGGMAGVYLAIERRLRRKVALKVMSPELMLGHNMIERFHQEAVTQANLEHPHIAAVHAVREQGGLHFFAMPYVGGRSLQAALRHELAEGRLLSPTVVTTLLHQVGSALDYAHGVGVIHRDVKPGNVLLGADGRALVTDFGIAKVTEGPALTATSMVQGTAAYMSPEQCYAAELTGASDQYSLGIMAYELVTGRVPFTGDSFSVMQAHAGKQAPRVDAVRPDCPSIIADAIERMLAKSAADRFPSITAALEQMHAVGFPARKEDPVRLELVRLAASEAVLQELGEEVRRAMLSPGSGESAVIPATRRGTGAVPVTMPPPPTVAAPTRPVTGGARVDRVTIEPHPAVLALGEQVMLRAQCLDSTGRPVASSVAWEGDADGVVRLSADGTVVAERWGRTRLRASGGGLTTTSEIVVGTVPIRVVEVLDLPETVVVGQRVPYRARVLDMRGQERAIPIQLETSDPSVAAADAGSVVRGIAPGSVEVIARCGSVESRRELRVLPA